MGGMNGRNLKYSKMKFTAEQITMIILATAVSIVLVLGMLGMMYGGKSTADNKDVRVAYIGILIVVVTQLFNYLKDKKSE